MKKLPALAALVGAGLAWVYVLAIDGGPGSTAPLAASPAVSAEAPGARPPRPAATDLEAIPTPATSYDPLDVEEELDALDRSSVRTAIETAAAVTLAKPRLMKYTMNGETIQIDHTGSALDHLVVSGATVNITWSGLEGGLLVVTPEQGLEDGLHSSEHAPGVPAAQGHVAGGLKTGLWTTWHANGERESEGRYVYGKQHGVWTVWHASGKRSSVGEYLYGEREGPWSEFHADGTKKETASYVNGKRDGRVATWHPGGARKTEALYSFGRPHLEFRSWNTNGEPAASGTYEYGHAVGRWRYWHADGTLDEQASGMYENGERIPD